MDQPAWLAAAWAEFGVREIPGKDDAPEILRYFRDAGDASVETEATPWCAAFLGAVLKRGGYAGTGSLLARSYLEWGDALDAARLGAVAVLSRGDEGKESYRERRLRFTPPQRGGRGWGEETPLMLRRDAGLSASPVAKPR